MKQDNVREMKNQINTLYYVYHLICLQLYIYVSKTLFFFININNLFYLFVGSHP